MNCQDYREIISAHVDGTLSARETVEAQSHLDQCSRCAQTFAWETKTTKILRQSYPPPAPKHELKQKILDRLGEADNRSLGWLSLSRAWAPAITLFLIIGLVYLVWPVRNDRDLFVDTVTNYRQANENLERFSHAADADPTARVLDLKPWGYRLLGKSVHRLKDRENRVFVYHGQQNDLLVAQEFEGESLSLSRGSTVVTKAGKNFVSRSHGNVNLVAWQDKNIICVLASSLPRDRIVALAAEIAQSG